MLKRAISIIAIIPIIFTLFTFIGNNEAYANSIKAIDMDVYIDTTGDAHITEIWRANLTEGTEGYRTFSELGRSKISDFTVSDDSGKSYTYLSDWNTSASFSSKAYKNGIHNTMDGLELCWGISDYGDRTYTLSYTISNFVTQYSDTQGIYFNLVNLDQRVGNVNINIHSDTDFSLDNARIWAFGYNGTIVFKNGSILLNSNGSLPSSRYMVALVRFEKNIFNVSNKLELSFEEIYDEAMSDVAREKYSPAPRYRSIMSFAPFLPLLLPILLYVFIMVFTMALFRRNSRAKRKNRTSMPAIELYFGAAGISLPADKEINYWREIPCDKDLVRAYWIAKQYNVVSTRTLGAGIIGAFLLKWLKDGIITVIKTKPGLLDIKDNNYAIDLHKAIYIRDAIENGLLEILLDAAGKNGILEANELKKWCRKNYIKINSWFSSIIENENLLLERQGLITEEHKEIPSRFGKTKTIAIKTVNPILKNDAIQLKGLMKFLLDFSLIYEREYFEVHIWEEYLIFAQLLGIADKVAEQFSKLYPKFNLQPQTSHPQTSHLYELDIEFTTVFASQMARIAYESMVEGIEIAASKASYSGSDSYSGGGGSSYDSGGSSAGGSSGGGFR
jgi:hypothetical protein